MWSRIVALLATLACALLPAWTAAAASPPPLIVDPNAPRQSTAGHVESYFDRTERKTLADIGEADWTAVGPDHYGKPVETGVVWLRLRLSNPSDQPLQRMMAIPRSLIDEVRATVDDGTTVRVHEVGEGTPAAQRPLGTTHPRFPVDIPARGNVRIVLRLYDEGTMPVPLVLGIAGELERAENARALEAGSFMGMLVICGGFGLLMFLRVRESLYLRLTLAALGLAGFVFVYIWRGLAPYLPAGNRSWWANRVVLGTICLAAISFGAFGITLLNLEERLPRLRRFLHASFALQLAATLWTVVGEYMYSVRMALSGLVATLVGLAAGTVLLAIRKDRVARDFLLGFVAFLGATLLMLLRAAGVISALLDGASMAGFALLVLGMAAAAARRYAETLEAQRLALQAQLAESERSAALSRTFEQFVPKEFLERLGHAEVTDIGLGDSVEKDMTVLFSDIRGFTSLVERMTPEENFAFVNDFLGHMEPAIHAEGGFIDKFIGDAVMALFDEASAKEGRAGARPAVAAAVAMHRALERFNATREEQGAPAIAIGVGLHTGALMLGTLGGKDRLSASVIGDAVNLAARVEGLTKRYGAPLLITERTVDALGDDHGFHLRPVDRVRVKGKRQPVTVFEVLDARAEDEAASFIDGLDAYMEAWEAFKEGDFETAKAGFEAWLEERSDAASELLRERCATLIEQGADHGWDGVTTLSTK